MANVQRILGQARRRLLARRVLRRAGSGLTVALAAAFLLLLADRGLAWGVPAAVYLAIGAAGAVLGVIRAIFEAQGALPAAVHLDRRCRLSDRLASAVAVARPGPGTDPAFAEMVRRDADRVAAGVDPRAAVPVPVPPVLVVAAAFAVVLAVGVAWLPEAGGAEAPVADPSATEEREQRRADAVEAIEDTARELAAEEETLDDDARKTVDALEALANQLGSPETSMPEKSPDEAAAELTELAEQVAAEARRDEAAAAELARRFSGLEQPERPLRREDLPVDLPPEDGAGSGSSPEISPGEVREALRDGDLERAADVLEEMMRRADELDDEERRAFAEEMRDLARDVAAAGAEEDPDLAAQREHLEQALRDQGIDEEKLRELMGEEDATPGAKDIPPATAEEIAEALRREGVDEQVAEDLARDVEKQRDAETARDQARRDAEQVAEALEEVAERAEEPTPRQEKPQDRQGETPEQRPRQQPGEQRDAPEQQQRQPSSEPGDQQQQQQQQQQPPGEQDQQQQQQPSGEQDQQQQQQQPSGEQDQQQQQQQQQRTSEPGEPPPGEQGRAPEQPGPDATGERPDPARTLREIQRRRRAAGAKRRAAERMEETARRLAEGMSEEERRRWAQQWARELDGEPGRGDARAPERDRAGSDAQARDLDLAGDEPIETPPIDWLDDRPDDVPRAPWAGPDDARRVRRAIHAAERAIEDSSVPPRYHDLIRRYFDRLKREADAPGEPAGSDDGS